MQIKKRNTLGIFFSLLLGVGAAGAFSTPRVDALAAAQDNSNQSRATSTQAFRTQRRSTEVASTDRHTACKNSCEEKYSSCLAAKKAKGWSDDRAAKTCGLSARTCKKGCDR
jgi:hypothetical protein